MKKRLLLLTGLIAALGVGGWTSTVNADPFLFDPDGPAGPLPAVTVASFDWLPGNALAQSSLPLTNGQDIQLLYQAKLGSLIDSNGSAINTPGLADPGATFQITAVASFTERVSIAPGSTTATFSLSPVQVNPFFEIYFNNSPVANNLAGTGFNVGTKILSGLPALQVAGGSVFSLLDIVHYHDFDQFLPNNYPGVYTVRGTGGTVVSFNVSTQNTGFFITPLTMGTTDFNTNQNTPFKQQDPSHLFVSLANAGFGDGPAPNVTPDLGSVNGGFGLALTPGSDATGVNGQPPPATLTSTGKDFQFQADANESFTPAIPEPASLVLLCMGLSAGLLGRGWLNRRRLA